ncbi:MAG TPA: helix-turn-helix transcriptional regulator [Mycobacteriales bacterium]|nr:helix-turn-helix transcriptional regulator [Mycobacteriales bacterium]
MPPPTNHGRSRLGVEQDFYVVFWFSSGIAELTAREDEVLRLAAQRLSNDDIAVRLKISRRTVEAHMRTLFRKTGVSRRSQLAEVVEGEFVPPDGPDPRLAHYDAVLRRLVDRHLPLFDERVEITLTVGGADGADTVVERRWTTPRPYVVYRMLRPILGSDAAGADPADLALVCDVQGRDVQAEVLAVTEPDGFPLAAVLFQPGLAEETEWRLRYRADGLWDPLRATGEDTLFWGTSTMALQHQPTTTEVVVRLVFPPGWTDVGLSERDGAGVVAEPVRQASGQQVLTWRADDPAASMYHWRLTGTRPG